MTPGVFVITTIAAVALLVSVAVLATTLMSPPNPRLARVRAGCLALTGVLFIVGVAGSHAPWLVLFASLGLLLTARAELAHRLGQTGRGEASEHEPAWWPKFEREFNAYAAREREQQRRRRRTP